MAGSADLFVVCKKCGSEVSPYITECPYCGSRLRKRAPRIERGEGEPRVRLPAIPSLGPLRPNEIPGIKGDSLGRPWVTGALVVASLIGLLVFQVLAPSDVYLSSLTGDPWRYATAAFAYDNPWYTFAVLLAIGIFGWRLELRHGPIVVLLLFLLCGIGANAAAVGLDDSAVLIGAPGAGLGLLAAWAVPDVRRAIGRREHEGDLLGALAIGATIALMPLATSQANAIATYSGLGIGLLVGLALSFSAAAS